METNLQQYSYADTDQLVRTARQYPRNVSQAIANIRQVCLSSPETAESMFYSLKRNDKDGTEKIIKGPSVRFAEIVYHFWGNLRAGARTVSNDGKSIVVQAVCHDLESNNALTIDITRSIVTSSGKTYSNDMQNITAMAAVAIGFRNVIFKTVPSVLLDDVMRQIEKLAAGSADEFPEKRQRTIAWFSKRRVTNEQILRYCEKDCIESLDINDVQNLCGLANAIKEGTTTIEEAFAPNQPSPEEKKKLIKQKVQMP